MALRSSGRKLSFEILSESSSVEEGQFLLYQSNTGPIEKVSASPEKPNRKKKKHRKKKPAESYSVVPEDPITESRFIDSNSAIQNGNVFLENRSSSVVGGESVVYTVIDVAEVAECQSVLSISGSELRQRNVSNGGGGEEEMVSSSRVEENGTVDSGVEVSSAEKLWRNEPNGSAVPSAKLEPAESLDWKRLMAEDPNFLFAVEISPVKYFVDEMYRGNSLRSTTTLGSEKERERVYDTIFRLPWRCELLIDVGFFVCLDSFLSLLTIMPTRMLMTLWRLLSRRQFKKPSAAELSDVGCFLVLASGVALLECTEELDAKY
ncbi:hypothetical protein P3X46_032838 [Hevea brasiliensis]|uniref:Uncharacterized protein n=1 Tax=Hevea brasiliensis TaxID=3981 RepID=A0ABQ9KEI8_HEVBR|nr:hypothetical protein P3X46_032838 [Hevea brasiliensis]